MYKEKLFKKSLKPVVPGLIIGVSLYIIEAFRNLTKVQQMHYESGVWPGTSVTC